MSDKLWREDPKTKPVVADIKDMTPNPDLIEVLEALLEEAKSGELRSLLMLKGYDDNTYGHAWAWDRRNNPRAAVGELGILQFEWMCQVASRDETLKLGEMKKDIDGE